jgi:glucose/arabinose dehydrogenase
LRVGERVRSVVAPLVAVLVVIVSVLPAVEAQAQVGPIYPLGPPIKLSLVATASQPVGVYRRPNDPRPYVVEKTGRIRALDGATWGPTLLDLRAKVSTENERGLFAMAVDPTDPTRLYVTYAARDGALTLSEFQINGDVADPETERVVLRIAHPNDDHYGAALLFDPSNHLLVSTGDGGGVGTRGGVGDRENNAQNPTVLLGKILRIDPRKNGSRAYQIPTDNPFATGKMPGISAKPAAPEVWAVGLRNPWRMSLDDSGMLWVADVGQASWEEINRVPVTQPAADFGWRLREGMHAYRGGRRLPGSIDPVFEFAHTKGRCAVIGGVVVGAKAGLPNLTGRYLFGELCSGRVAALDVTGTAPVRATVSDLGDRSAYLTFVGQGPDDRIYATSLNGGVYRIDAR